METLVGNSKKSLPQCGNDCMRFWTVHEYHKTKIQIGPVILNKMFDRVFEIRSILRFLIANTYDYTKPSNIDYGRLYPIDKYILSRLLDLIKQTNALYDDLQLNKILINIERFLVNDLSSLYIKTVKDRLYCELPSSAQRQSAQYALSQLLEHLVFLLAPILPSLCQDAFMNSVIGERFPNKKLFANTYKFAIDTIEIWNNPEIMSLFEIVLKMRNEFFTQIPSENESMFEIKIDCDQKLNQLLHVCFGFNSDSINECFSNSHVRLGTLSPGTDVKENLQTINGHSFRVEATRMVDPTACLRCRRYLKTNSQSLCKRCEDVLSRLESWFLARTCHSRNIK